MLKLAAVFFVVLVSTATAQMALTPDQAERAIALEEELRCVVCQNQTIAESNAPLARDMRLLVRERIAKGDTDADVKTFLIDRYGEFVLFRPVFAPHTWALWAAPVLVLLLGLWLARGVVSGRALQIDADDHDGLSEADEARLAAMLGTAPLGETTDAKQPDAAANRPPR